MVLGEMVGVEAGAVIGVDDRQPIGVEIGERAVAAVEIIEDAELHRHRYRRLPEYRPRSR